MEGLGKPHESDKKLISLIGKIPYLNGGLFDVHELEKDNDHLDVKDEAFERLFNFFDEFNWHLDDRITASGKDINPDVLGYIFEKYINDRASMGAYYTKEDITEYISKNCIIPFLFDRTKENCTNALLPGSSIWQMLKNDPDRYIYDAVKHGINYDDGINQGLPEEIIEGLEANDNELVEKRKAWNRPAPAEIALPTEIYREVIERRKRYFEIRDKIEKGEIHEINDFITYNLNIRQFAQDAIENYEGSDFIESFFAAIAGRKYDEKNSSKEPTLGITILDPTCGSGAFLFAALNVLEPLYEGCLKRMKEFVEEDNKHLGKKFKQFRIVLKEIENHPSEAYYILKSIILNNLYGVDIMKEAVETAKLRLFLKLVAQTSDIEHVEPLPDIDFNIRCGNTLVGFATEEELQKGLTWTLDGPTARPLIEESCETVAMAFSLYKQIQLTQNDDYDEFCEAKLELNNRLKILNERLNKLLKLQTSDLKYEKWLNTYQPFHWFAEFYEIVHDKGGFDVLIGNPPYIELKDVNGYSTERYTLHSCGNLYALILERALTLKTDYGMVGMIIPLSISSSNRMKPLQVLIKKSGSNWISNYEGGTNPSVMFNGVKQNLSILIHKKTIEKSRIYSTKIYRFFSEEREYLFHKICYTKNDEIFISYGFPKISSTLEYKILKKLFTKKPLGYHLDKSGKSVVYVHRIASYYIKCFDFIPYFENKRDGIKKSEDYKPFSFRFNAHRYLSILSSSTFYVYWLVFYDLFKAGKYAIESFPVGELNDENKNIVLDNIGLRLMIDLKSNSKRMVVNYKNTGKVEYDQFFPRLSKDIMDEIDLAIADQYGFTSEELDFITNYDIKYRMGKELDNGEEE